MQRVIKISEIRDYAEYIDADIIEYIDFEQVETYESFGNYDLIAFDWYDIQNSNSKPSQILIYIDRDDLFYICENDASYVAALKLFTEGESNELAMYYFFRNLFRGSAKHMDCLEACVSELDDDVADGTESGLKEKLTDLRNSILKEKKYYEQLEFLFEEICDNDNGLISRESLKYYEVLHNRSVRLLSQIVNLREYITQVKESYLTQIGIEQNNLMKAFTLVTSIFLPLTLIVGWYGMNLKMPEFGWRFGYLFVAGLCLLVGLTWFLLFKKKKWF